MQAEEISRIYAAIGAADPWRRLAGSVRALTDTNSITINLSVGTQPSEMGYIVDADWDFQADLHQYASKYSDIHPVKLANMVPGRLYQLDHVIAPDALHRTRIWREFCAPRDLQHGFFYNLGSFQGQDAWLSGGRCGRRGPFQSQEIARFSELLPHVAQAADIILKLENQQLRAATYRNALAALNIEVLALDACGKFVSVDGEAAAACLDRYSNDTAKAIVLQIGDMRHLLAKSSETASCFREAGPPDDRISIVLRRDLDAVGFRQPRNCAYLAFLRPHNQALPGGLAGMLAKELGFSPAEARLAIMLAEGLTIEQAAGQLKITQQTARTYCKRALSKAGLSRQLDLVRFILNSLVHLA